MDNLASSDTNTRKFILASCFRRIVPCVHNAEGVGVDKHVVVDKRRRGEGGKGATLGLGWEGNGWQGISWKGGRASSWRLKEDQLYNIEGLASYHFNEHQLCPVL